MESYNEDLAITYLVPKVNKVDFEPMVAALKEFFVQTHGVHVAEVQPYPIGNAYVLFHNPVERERFLDKIIQFGPDYQIYVGKHNEGKNARFQDMDREAWIMLISFPEDARNNSTICKAVADFGLLHYWNDTNNLARIVAKINLFDGAKIPHGVLVSTSIPLKTRSCMYLVFVLTNKGITMLADEDQLPADGPLFPLPMQAPRWMGLHGNVHAPRPQAIGEESFVGQGAQSAAAMDEDS
uniref:Uncharacterized protein n=1 Tax=Setaria viridis TaxID=4556 RepID=A0A4U6V2F2_SETVI|nr:hypothetical protein SEVIR_4G121900v2 [Setaria viridis]